MYNKSMLFDTKEMQKQSLQVQESYLCSTKSFFFAIFLYAIFDRHRVLFSKFDVIKDSIAAYQVAITFLSKE